MTLSPHHLGIKVTARDLKVRDTGGSQSRVLGLTERQGKQWKQYCVLPAG